MTSSDNSAQSAGRRPGGVRQLADAVVCLALAVILFRAFQVEGYMISTGSMAPTLLGYHNRVVCPSCQFPFAVGVTADDAETENSAAREDVDLNPLRPGVKSAICPNCGRSAIDITGVPRNQGDQLLVHKHAFLLRPPRRWEVAVFRNPYKPSQAYVKRIVGLPGESIQVIDGDVYIDGTIRRKRLASQRAIRISVYDDNFRPAIEPDSKSPAGRSESPTRSWRPRWSPEPARIPWTETAGRFDFDGDRPDLPGSDIQETAWVRYRHVVRPAKPDLPPQPAPVMDYYAYNRPDDAPAVHAVRDLMISAEVTIHRGSGEFVIEMTDGEQTYGFVIDVAQREVRLFVTEPDSPGNGLSESGSVARRTVVRRAPFSPEEYFSPDEDQQDKLLLEMSLMDRQVLAAINGGLPFEPWPMPEQRPSSPPPTAPVRFGARGLAVSVAALKLFRDVYYTDGKGINGVDRPYRLDNDEYFMLGDNSPVSLDSRSWADGAVERRLFVGKPFLVHLPSRPGKLRIGSHNAYFRIPDFPRIRYIR